MLAERVAEWPKQWQEEGRQKGLEQGRQVLFEVALGLLERRFGSVDQETRRSLEARSMEELSRLAIEIPTASSLHELGLC